MIGYVNISRLSSAVGANGGPFVSGGIREFCFSELQSYEFFDLSEFSF